MQTDLRVLILTPDFPPAPGGIQLVAHRLVRHGGRLEARVLTRHCPGDEEFDRREGLDVRRVGGPEGRVANLRVNARGLLEGMRFRPEAVLSTHIVTSLAPSVLRRVLRIPVVQYLHADEVRARPRLTRFAIRNADAVVAVSRYTEELALAFGAGRERLHRIPNGVDPPASPRSERAPEPTLITVARLRERYKGHDVLARAFPLIRARVPEARWVVVGDGPLRPRLERMLAAQGVRDQVDFTGEVSELERDAWLDRAHVFVMPSRLPAGGVGGEGFGISYLEAGAHGLPVVAGNVGGALDAVVHGRTGLLVDPQDHLAVATAVSDLLLNRRLAEELGHAGREHATRLGWPSIARRVEDLLVALVRDEAAAPAKDGVREAGC